MSTEETKETKKLPLVRREENTVRKLVERLTKMSERLTRFDSPEVTAQFKVAINAIGTAADGLGALPDDAGTKAKPVTASFDIGVKVDVKERFVKNYEDLLEEDDLRGLEIFKIARGKLGVQTSDGIRMFLPKTHLVPATVEA